MKKFYFQPSDEKTFKKKAVNNFVRTIIFDTQNDCIVDSYIRSVKTLWQQTCKNNIETDSRVKKLTSGNFEIYSWVTTSKNSLNLPNFKAI